RRFVARTSVSSRGTSPPSERRTAPAGTVSMLRRRKEGSGQIITKPTEERESAEISFGGQVSEDERQPTPRMATPRVATIRLVSHARRPSAWCLTRDSRGIPVAIRYPCNPDRRNTFAGASGGERRKGPTGVPRGSGQRRPGTPG